MLFAKIKIRVVTYLLPLDRQIRRLNRLNSIGFGSFGPGFGNPGRARWVARDRKRFKMDLDELRREFPLTKELTFLDHAATSPLPGRTRAAMTRFIETRRFVRQAWEEYDTLDQDLRKALGKLINASPEEIALVQNTAEGINIAAHAIHFQPGDNVIFCDMEYPANVYPWLNLERRGVEARIIPHREGGLALDDLEQYLDQRTRVVTASSVEFLTGFRNDLKGIGELCKTKGIYFVVDGIQSLGVIPLDVRECQIDMLSCGGPKWLIGPCGQGFFFCRRELIEEMIPAYAGAESVVDFENFRDYDLTFLPDAKRFELGTDNLAGKVGLLASVNLLLEVGIEEIQRWTLHLTEVLIEDLQERGYQIASCLRPEHRSAIISFPTPDVKAAYDKLIANKVIVSLRENYIRVSPHCYNTEEEVLRVGQVLGDCY
ncbi:MAG: aminotransferase class V-fold PLP-dependent enzyme [Anaerolineae bacterium]